MIELMNETDVEVDSWEALLEAMERLDVDKALWQDPSQALPVLRSAAVLLLHGVILVPESAGTTSTKHERASEDAAMPDDLLIESSWRYIRDFLRFEEAIQRGVRHPGRWRRRLLTRLRRIEALLTFPFSDLWLTSGDQ